MKFREVRNSQIKPISLILFSRIYFSFQHEKVQILNYNQNYIVTKTTVFYNIDLHVTFGRPTEHRSFSLPITFITNDDVQEILGMKWLHIAQYVLVL